MIILYDGNDGDAAAAADDDDDEYYMKFTIKHDGTSTTNLRFLRSYHRHNKSCDQPELESDNYFFNYSHFHFVHSRTE